MAKMKITGLEEEVLNNRERIVELERMVLFLERHGNPFPRYLDLPPLSKPTETTSKKVTAE